MKILVITFTGGLNPGTIMQALGVQTGLKKAFPNASVEFLKFPDFKRSGIVGVRGKKDALWHTFLQKVYALYRLQKYNKLRAENFCYTSSVDLFNYKQEEIEFIKDYDLVVIGSDTILEQAYSPNGQIGLNWMPLSVKKIFFAASASPANFAPIEGLSRIASNAKYIGLRDDLTINLFCDKLGISKELVTKQPDPSFFLDISKYKFPRKLAKKLKKGSKYALYNFNSNFPLRKELADGIRSVGYKVVTTAYNPYADICFDTIDALEWAGIFPLMDVIVTERFHDSIFGLRNEKPVIAIDWDPNRFSEDGDSKTLRVLEDFGHEHLHFNMCNSTELKSVLKVLGNVHQLFDVEKVKSANLNIQKSLEQILVKITNICIV